MEIDSIIIDKEDKLMQIKIRYNRGYQWHIKTLEPERLSIKNLVDIINTFGKYYRCDNNAHYIREYCKYYGIILKIF